MRTLTQALTIAAAMIALALPVTSAQAQASRTWVSGVGDDANPCSRTAPCKTFAGAISKTALNGEINCLDPGGFGAVTITKSITIDCHEIFGSILHSGTTGINIPFDSFVTVGEVRKTVRLRNLSFDGFDTGFNGIRITGGAGSANSEVFIEDCLIDGSFSGTARGISDERTGGGKLFVTNTTVRNVGGSGIVMITGATRMEGVFNNVRSMNNGVGGLAIAGNIKAMVTNSLFSGNVNMGVDSEGAGAETMLENVTLSSNANGLTTFSGGILRVSNSVIANNTTAANGAWTSFGNNKLSGNTNPGTGPTPTGQQ